ncbi:hypothetical protein [Deinococcus sonorensis]|uniref:Uncharacterized protein n=1 Tax=Deinococcus sonorensis TaxID=309891 RepID=A0ABV8Y867_9DEIO
MQTATVGNAAKILGERQETVVVDGTAADEFLELKLQMMAEYRPLSTSDALSVLHALRAAPDAEREALRQLLHNSTLPIVLAIAAKKATRFMGGLLEAYASLLTTSYELTLSWQGVDVGWDEYLTRSLTRQVEDLAADADGRPSARGQRIFEIAVRDLEADGTPYDPAAVLEQVAAFYAAKGSELAQYWTLKHVQSLHQRTLVQKALSIELSTDDDKGSLGDTLAVEEREIPPHLQRALEAMYRSLREEKAQDGRLLNTVVYHLIQHEPDALQQLLQATRSPIKGALPVWCDLHQLDVKDGRRIAELALSIDQHWQA